MQLPDEAISYDYQAVLIPASEEWTLMAESRSKHFLNAARIREIGAKLMQLRSQVAAERDLQQVPPELQPLDSAFIDYPQKLLDQHRRKNEESILGRILTRAARLREQADRVVILGIGGSYLGARALFEALKSAYHNDLPAKVRLDVPRIFLEGNNLDNDVMQDLLDMLQETCVDPETREERWAVIVISKSGGTLETAVANRVLKRDAVEYYGSKSERLKDLFVPITGPAGKMRDLVKAEGYTDDEIFSIPDRIGGRFSVFTACGLLPAAVMGLDIRALLQGASAMTRRFLEEPFERNPVLQFAAVNYLMAEELGKPMRVLSVWSKKLEALGLWYDQLLSESLGKQGRGPTPLTFVATRDLHSRGQQHQEGTRDKFINNLVVRTPRAQPIMVQMADRNEDDLNALSRKGYPDLLEAALKGTNQAYADVARPTADLIVPTLSEHTVGQLMQMLMLATVVEGRLWGINPYGQPGVEAYKRNMKNILRAPVTT